MRLLVIIIRRIEENEYSVLPEIEAMSDETFLKAGIDLSHFSSTPSTYYESLDKEKSGIFVAVKEEQIIGFCYTTTVDNNGYLGELSVIPQYTRQGIGTKLLYRAVEWTKEKNYEYLLLTTFADVPFNGPMYRKFGFEEFIPDKDYPQLCQIRIDEVSSGVEVAKRIAMRKCMRQK